LRRINRLHSSRELVVGKDLIVPATAEDLRVRRPGQEYIVQPGDSLSEIAKSFDLSLAELMTANYIGNPNTITVGQRLVIPAAAAEQNQPAQKRPQVGPGRSGYLYYTV